MKYTLFSLLTFSAFFALPMAAKADESPLGEWLVEDATAHIRVMRCDDVLWGVISWEQKPGTDSENPDISKQKLPVLGLPILLSMKPVDDRWEGQIYNAENGKTYSGSIHLESKDVLHIQGCLMGHYLCGGENWKRMEMPKDTQFSCAALKLRLSH